MLIVLLRMRCVAETSSPYSGVVGLGSGTVDGSSPGLPLALPAEPTSQPASHTGSPDPSAALTVLQPSSGTTQHYSMLPSFGYTTGTYFNRIQRKIITASQNLLRENMFHSAKIIRKVN